MPIFLLFAYLLSAYAQPWIPQVGYQYQQPTCETAPEIEYDEPEPYFDAYGSETPHDSWDNLYLCQYCETEIIIDPYGNNYTDNENDY